MTIRELRDKAEMSRQEFADCLGIPRGTIRNWEQGVRVPPDYIVMLIEKALKYDKKLKE